MSYIRPLSNPEGLYIIGNMYGQIEIMLSGLTGDFITIPKHVFHHVALRWLTHNFDEYEGIHYRGLSVKESDSDWKIVLTYKGKELCRMYTVTWDYICSGIELREKA